MFFGGGRSVFVDGETKCTCIVAEVRTLDGVLERKKEMVVLA